MSSARNNGGPESASPDSASMWSGPPPREVCIVMLSAIGDAVHVLPVANALKRAWPQTRITWVIQPVPHQLVKDHPAIDDFVLFHRRRGLRGWMGFADFARDVRERKFDLLLGLQVYFKAGVLTALVNSDVKLGFDRARARDMQWLFTNRRIPPHPPQHVQDQKAEDDRAGPEVLPDPAGRAGQHECLHPQPGGDAHGMDDRRRVVRHQRRLP